MKIDNRKLTKLGYNEIYHLIMLIELRMKSLDNEFAIGNINSEMLNYRRYLVDLQKTMLAFLDEKLKKIGGIENDSAE